MSCVTKNIGKVGKINIFSISFSYNVCFMAAVVVMQCFNHLFMLIWELGGQKQT